MSDNTDKFDYPLPNDIVGCLFWQQQDTVVVPQQNDAWAFYVVQGSARVPFMTWRGVTDALRTALNNVPPGAYTMTQLQSLLCNPVIV